MLTERQSLLYIENLYQFVFFIVRMIALEICTKIFTVLRKNHAYIGHRAQISFHPQHKQYLISSFSRPEISWNNLETCICHKCKTPEFSMGMISWLFSYGPQMKVSVFTYHCQTSKYGTFITCNFSLWCENYIVDFCYLDPVKTFPQPTA